MRERNVARQCPSRQKRRLSTGSGWRGRRTLAALLAIFFLCTLFWGSLGLAVAAGQTAGETVGQTSDFTATELTDKAVDFIKGKYKAGEKIDGYAAYVLSRAGQDLGSKEWEADPWWTAGRRTLKDKILELARLLDDYSSPVTFIARTQNPSGTFGPYDTAYGTRAALQALAVSLPRIKRDASIPGYVYGEVENAIERAVEYFKTGYRSGSMSYDAGGWDLDFRAVEALTAAGEDLASAEWSRQNVSGALVSLQEEVVASAVYAAQNADAFDPIRLAKELTALLAVGGGALSDSDSPYASAVEGLTAAILQKANRSVSGEVYFGNNIYDDVLVLTALGKAGKIREINSAEALNYLNHYRHSHSSNWGVPAGDAWGGWYEEEPDTTAQVITALSYFPEADTAGGDVAEAIEAGLTYLADIQDPDTAAISHPWDSTFSTAETVIALSARNKDFWSTNSPWVKRARTKSIALCLLAASSWENGKEAKERLAQMLAARQKKPEGGAQEPSLANLGAGSFENSVYSDMWAYLALAAAGKTDLIDRDAAVTYVLSKQAADGSWGETFGGSYWADFISTAQAIRALYALVPQEAVAQGNLVQSAIDRGLSYLKGLQQADGGVYQPSFDDPAVDNAELIVTLHALGKKPTGEEWRNQNGLTPVDYLLRNSFHPDDGSFGGCRNVFAAAEVLSALIVLEPEAESPSEPAAPPGGGGGGGSTPVQKDVIVVNIAVVGRNGELLYGPGEVEVKKSSTYGFSVLEALLATGLDVGFDGSTGFVGSIAGQANSGLNGWMYKVNEEVPMVSAKDKRLSGGEKIIWWYSTDINSRGPSWSDLQKGSASASATVEATTQVTAATSKAAELPPALSLSEEAQKNLTSLLRNLQDLGKKEVPLGDSLLNTGMRLTAVTGEMPAGNFKEAIKERRQILKSEFKIEKAVDVAGAIIASESGEVALSVPPGALTGSITVTVTHAREQSREQAGTPGKNAEVSQLPAGFRPISGIYRLEPAGVTLLQPATLVLKCPLPPAVAPEEVIVSGYDQERKTWVALPAVVDVSKGLIGVSLERLGDVTILAREKRVSFEDIAPGKYGWAQEGIEKLAGAGVLTGVGSGRFEPERQITRAELAAMLTRALGIKVEDPSAGKSFSDVPADRWYAPYVAAAAAAGLFTGYEDGTFNPERPVTRQEAAVVLVRACQFDFSAPGKLPFADAAFLGGWAADAVATAVAEGIVKGYEDGTFKPQRPVTRAECAVLVYRALRKL